MSNLSVQTTPLVTINCLHKKNGTETNINIADSRKNIVASVVCILLVTLLTETQ